MDLLPHPTLRRFGAYDTGRRNFSPEGTSYDKVCSFNGGKKFQTSFLHEDPAHDFVDFTKPELLEIVQMLGIAHQLLPDNGPRERFSDDDTDLDDAVEAEWRLEIAPLTKIATIFFDHPCFGLLSFMKGRETAENMMRQLSLFVDTPQSDKKLN